LNKAAIIERALRRMKEEYNADPTLGNFTHVDAMILNIERACQSAIDLALHLVAAHHLGVPQTSAEAFILLEKSGRITPKSARAMVGMTGFRNVAVHQYQTLEMDILRAVATKEYLSLITFLAELGVRIAP
jgi:uncharacterized protein YutE (UPF0331/DUF86 family)